MIAYCSQCGAKLAGRFCWRCGTEGVNATATAPGPDPQRLARVLAELDLRSIASGFVTVALGVAAFVFPYAGFLLALATVTAIAFAFLKDPADDVPTGR
jgi:hypothetical protein